MTTTAEIMTAPTGAIITTPDGPLVVHAGGWDWLMPDRPDLAALLREWDMDAFHAAAGPYDHVTLTEDGRPAWVSRWCLCGTGQGTSVRYERWATAGRVAHGYVCPACRYLTQTG